MDEVDPVYSRTESMSDYKKDLEDYFCRFTFGQFITLVLFEIVTLFFVFYLGAKYGTDLVGADASVARHEATVEDSLLPQGKKSVDDIVGDNTNSYTYPEVLSGNSKAIRIKPSGVSTADLEKQAAKQQEPIQVPSSRSVDDVKEVAPPPLAREAMPTSPREASADAAAPKVFPRTDTKIGAKTTVKTPGQLTAEEIEKEAQKNPVINEPSREMAREPVREVPAEVGGEPIAEAKPAGIEKPLSPPAPSGKFSVQMGSYPSAGEAQAALKFWKKKGYSAFVKEADIPGKGLWYRVRVGNFSNKSQAQSLLDKIKKKEKKTGIVVSNRG